VGQLHEELSRGRCQVRGRIPRTRLGQWPNAVGVIEQGVGHAVYRAEQFAVDVELALFPRVVANPNRRRVPPALQVPQLQLAEVPLTADAEHDLQVAALLER